MQLSQQQLGACAGSSSRGGGAHRAHRCLNTSPVLQHSRQGALPGRIAATTTTAAPLLPLRHAAAAPARTRPSTRCRAAPEANVAAVQESLADYICRGPLLAAAGITPQQVQQELGTWRKLGRRLEEQLGFDHDALDEVQRLRVYHYYLPVFFWVQQQLAQHKAAHGGAAAPPLVLGISAPQGCGKSTLVEQLEALMAWLGVAAASVSIDDFYLTHAQQAALAAAHPGNRLLALRGNAGTHDLELGQQTLARLRSLTQAGDTAPVPRYDKSAFAGRGDRADPATWPVVGGPLDLVLFEGWMAGFRPVGQAAAAAVEPALAEVDARLAAYEAAWDSQVDSWLVIRIADPQWVFGWRLQAEQRMRASGKPGMTDEQIADFVSRYMPAYTAYLPGLYASGPTTAQAGHSLVIEVDAGRSPVAQQPPQPV